MMGNEVEVKAKEEQIFPQIVWLTSLPGIRIKVSVH